MATHVDVPLIAATGIVFAISAMISAFAGFTERRDITRRLVFAMVALALGGFALLILGGLYFAKIEY